MKTKLRNGVSFKIVVVFVLCLIPLYVMLMVNLRSYLASLRIQAVNSAQSILDISLNGLAAEISRLDYYFYTTQETNTDFIRLCSWEGNSMDYISLYAMNRDLIDQKAFCSYADVLYLYVESTDTLLEASGILQVSEKDRLSRLIEENHLAEVSRDWGWIRIDGKNYFVRTTGYYGVYLGALIDMDLFMDQLKEDLDYEKIQIYMDQEPVAEEKTGFVSVTGEVGSTGSYVHIHLDRQEIGLMMPVVARITYWLSLFSFLIIPVLFLILWKIIVKPIHRIERGLKGLGEGKSEGIPFFKSSSEFVSLQDSINSMVGEIHALKIQSYEKKLEREQMAFQNLLLQTRPHFLLNTFNQIFAMAQLKDFEGIQQMSVYLSKYFRHMFQSGKTVTIRSEAEVVENFIRMMERRFIDCFTVTWDLDEALLDYRIPPLLLHNFVENIFKYAVSEDTETSIRIVLKKENDYGVLTIKDDGPGMEPEILEKIQAMKPIDKKDGTHIGIYNSHYRLKTMCGEKCRLIVGSVLTEGTTIKIMLPLEKELPEA